MAGPEEARIRQRWQRDIARARAQYQRAYKEAGDSPPWPRIRLMRSQAIHAHRAAIKALTSHYEPLLLAAIERDARNLEALTRECIEAGYILQEY